MGKDREMRKVILGGMSKEEHLKSVKLGGLLIRLGNTDSTVRRLTGLKELQVEILHITQLKQ